MQIPPLRDTAERSRSIDTGTDYKHPALGGGFGRGFKVAGGYDFVGDNYDGSNTPEPDNDPLDNCAGHGTHVAVRCNPMRDGGCQSVLKRIPGHHWGQSR